LGNCPDRAGAVSWFLDDGHLSATIGALHFFRTGRHNFCYWPRAEFLAPVATNPGGVPTRFPKESGASDSSAKSTFRNRDFSSNAIAG
jgi:hypothetical protein